MSNPERLDIAPTTEKSCIYVDGAWCVHCGACLIACSHECLEDREEYPPKLDMGCCRQWPLCWACVAVCPADAIRICPIAK